MFTNSDFDEGFVFSFSDFKVAMLPLSCRCTQIIGFCLCVWVVSRLRQVFHLSSCLTQTAVRLSSDGANSFILKLFSSCLFYLVKIYFVYFLLLLSLIIFSLPKWFWDIIPFPKVVYLQGIISFFYSFLIHVLEYLFVLALFLPSLN